MCTTCGCGAGEVRIDGEHAHHEHDHVHADGTRTVTTTTMRRARPTTMPTAHAHAPQLCARAFACAGRQHQAHGADRAGHPVQEQCLCGAKPAAPGGARHFRAEPGFQPRFGQDHAAGEDHRDAQGQAARHGDRRRPADQPGCRAHPRHRRAGGADQYRQGLPSRRAHGRSCHGQARACRGFAADDRERRQSGVSGGVRSRRGAQGGDPLRHRGRGQADQVSRHVPRRAT